MKFSKVISVFTLLCIPSICLADELDDVLDDLIDARLAKPAALAGSLSEQVAEPGVVAFKPIADFKIINSARTEDSTAVEQRTTYVSTTGGTSYDVRIVSPLTRANFVLDAKMREIVLAYQNGLRSQPITIQGAAGGFIDTKGTLVSGVALLLSDESYLIVRASRATDRKGLIKFVEMLGLTKSSAPQAA